MKKTRVGVFQNECDMNGFIDACEQEDYEVVEVATWVTPGSRSDGFTVPASFATTIVMEKMEEES